MQLILTSWLCVQERDLKTFHDGLKQDMKLLKQSIDMLPKDMRKDMLRQRKEEKDAEQAEKVVKSCNFTFGLGMCRIDFVYLLV